MNRHFRGAVLAAIFCSLLSAASLEAGWLSYWFTGRRTSDASAHPAAQEVIGKEIRIKQDSFVVRMRSKEYFWLNPPGQGFSFQPKSVEEYYSQVQNQTLDPQVLGLVEKGTHIKITHVELHEDRKIGYRLLIPFATIQSGKFKGWSIDASAFLCTALRVETNMPLEERFGEFVDPQQPNIVAASG